MRYLYTKTHEYICIGSGKTVQVGISDYAQKQLGDIVYVNLPEMGQTFSKGEVFAAVESVKAASDILGPCDGIITKVNLELDGRPELLNEDPKKNWICEAEIRGSIPTDLMSEEKYLKYIATL